MYIKIKIKIKMLKELIETSTKHLHQQNMNMLQHGLTSIHYSFILFKGTCKGVIHSVVPGVYDKFTQETIDELNEAFPCTGNKKTE